LVRLAVLDENSKERFSKKRPCPKVIAKNSIKNVFLFYRMIFILDQVVDNEQDSRFSSGFSFGVLIHLEVVEMLGIKNSMYSSKTN
jgi:hypothetical protein